MCSIRVQMSLVAVFLSILLSDPAAAKDIVESMDISTTNLYGIPAALKKENPKLEGVAIIASHPISAHRSAILVGTGSFPWISETFRLFLVNPSSGTLVKSITTFDSVSPGNTIPDIKAAGPDYITVVQEDADYGGELARTKYFFNELSSAPVKSVSYKPVSINISTRFGDSLYLSGLSGNEGVIIRLGLKNGNPDPGNWERITSIGGEKLSRITLAKVEDGGLRMYTHTETYAFDGKVWTKVSGPDSRYFRPAKDPCSLFPTEALMRNNGFLYEKCDKERHVQGDAATVGYEGPCETDNPGEHFWLWDSYAGALERYAVAEHVVNSSRVPLRRFFVWNSEMPSTAHVTGIYEIRGKTCKFYPMPVPTNDILTRFRPKKAAEGCGLNDKIGPFQKLDDRIWFCKNFYGGEGECGVGAAGYFDLKEKVFDIIYSSQTAKWSCSAILAEKETVWMGLEHIGEGYTYSGGLAALDIVSNNITTYELPVGISVIQRAGDSLIIGAGDGIYILSAAGKISFLGPEIDKNGKYQLNLVE